MKPGDIVKDRNGTTWNVWEVQEVQPARTFPGHSYVLVFQPFGMVTVIPSFHLTVINPAGDTPAATTPT